MYDSISQSFNMSVNTELCITSAHQEVLQHFFLVNIFQFGNLLVYYKDEWHNNLSCAAAGRNLSTSDLTDEHPGCHTLFIYLLKPSSWKFNMFLARNFCSYWINWFLFTANAWWKITMWRLGWWMTTTDSQPTLTHWTLTTQSCGCKVFWLHHGCQNCLCLFKKMIVIP